MIKTLLVILFIFFILLILCCNNYKHKLNKRFYSIEEISLNLNKIYDYNLEDLQSEVYNVSNWKDWPEVELYDKKNNTESWKVFPFYVFGSWSEPNCRKCPIITDFLKKIKGLKAASLSKLSPGMKLKPHRGWASHSNYVIRCHFGIIVPDNCFISVTDDEKIEEKQYHQENKWLIFDDAKLHYAQNKSSSDRIVLIVDIERPSNIKIGTSTSEDSKELLDFVEAFRIGQV